MQDAPPELESQVRTGYARAVPGRHFLGCKFASREQHLVVRIYSQANERDRLMPPPYQIFRFDPATGVLSAPSKDEVAEFTIRNYK